MEKLLKQIEVIGMTFLRHSFHKMINTVTKGRGIHHFRPQLKLDFRSLVAGTGSNMAD